MPYHQDMAEAYFEGKEVPHEELPYPAWEGLPESNGEGQTPSRGTNLPKSVLAGLPFHLTNRRALKPVTVLAGLD